MANVINLKEHKKNIITNDENYKSKLLRIRDSMEDYLFEKSLGENDELAVSLAAGRYAAMNLAKLVGETETINFFKDCIKTSLSKKD